MDILVVDQAGLAEGVGIRGAQQPSSCRRNASLKATAVAQFPSSLRPEPRVGL
jgi:hypothetical protein